MASELAGRCRDCRHWGVPRNKQETNEPHGPWGVCARGESSDGQPEDRATLAFARDDEEYVARLMTAAAFGCVQWEAPDGQ